MNNMIATAGSYIRVVFSSATLQSSTRRVFIRSSVAVPTSVVVAEAEAIIDEPYIQAYHAVVPKRTMEEEEAEEREWESIVSKPHVRDVLRRMAAEARQQYYARETEEGGFGLE